MAALSFWSVYYTLCVLCRGELGYSYFWTGIWKSETEEDENRRRNNETTKDRPNKR
jgi:hypothetical protein